MTRPQPSGRADYPFFTQLHTRWDDNDIYGHLNNTVHYKLMDTAVNGWPVSYTHPPSPRDRQKSRMPSSA